MSRLKIGLIVLTATLASADSITTLDSRTWNGTITNIQGGVVTLNAQFSGQTKPLNFGAEYIRSIQFSPTTYNPGAIQSPPNPKSSKLPGKIYLQKQAGKSRPPFSCQDITFSGRTISCSGDVAGKPDLVQKQDVVQILIGPQ
jgi:hypothetical protein